MPALIVGVSLGHLWMAPPTFGQSVPVPVPSQLYTPFSLPTVRGTLNYSISGNESQTFGYNGGPTSHGGGLSGNLGFSAASALRPFSLSYSGGLYFSDQGGRSPYNQSLSLSQAFHLSRWTVGLSDSLSYSPQTPTTGLSGIPGQGDLGITTGTDTNQQIITINSARIGNAAGVSVSRQITGRTSLAGSGSYSIQRFTGNSAAVSSNSLGGGLSLSHRFDVRSSLSFSYNYGQSSNASQPGSFNSQGASISYTRQLTPQLSVGLGAGPQIVGGSTIANAPSSLTYSADCHLSYTGRSINASMLSLSYVRAENVGSGVSLGVLTDSYGLVATRRITRSLQPSAQVTFSRSTGVAAAGDAGLDARSLVGSTQINRSLGRELSLYASYTALHQTYSGSSSGLAPATGVIQTLSFGVTYSPTTTRVGRQ